MAQHIPIKNIDLKAFRTIESGIRYAFVKSRGLLRTSMRYEYIGEQDGKDVYTTYRKIPKGIVHGDDKGIFEIHYDKQKRAISDIYLVA